VPPESGDVCAVLAIEDLSQVPFPINKCHQRVVTRNSSANTRTTWILFPINRCHQRVVTHHLRDVAIAFRVEFPIKWCHQLVVTLADSAPDEPDESIEFSIKWCHQRVVTAASERACAAIDPKTVCAPPYRGGAWAACQACGKR
jgi:hypothetical protein